MLRIVGDGIEKRLVAAGHQRVPIVRHEEQLAPTLATQLVDPLVKAGGVGEIEVGIGLAAVAVAARDQKLLPARGQLFDAAIFFPVAQTVQLKGVQVCRC